MTSPDLSSKGPETVEICDECAAPANPPRSYWFADNDLWNEIVGSADGYLCPRCFTDLCLANGVQIGWRAGRVGEIEP